MLTPFNQENSDFGTSIPGWDLKHGNPEIPSKFLFLNCLFIPLNSLYLKIHCKLVNIITNDMRLFNIIMGFTILTTIISCSEGITDPDNSFCGTGSGSGSAWIKDSLKGNWTIYAIAYSKGNGEIHLVDTTYNLTAPLTLNSNGTGTLYSSSISWKFSVSQGFYPKLTITDIDTLYPFTVNFIQNNAADMYILPIPIPPLDEFCTTVEQDINGQWEKTTIYFRR
jgi:hypothetical protein